jgi:SM-20-related protein
MSLIDIDAFRSISLSSEPFPHAVVPNFIPPRSLPAVVADYPDVSQGGSFPVNALTYGRTFAQLCQELTGDLLRVAFEEKFDMSLSRRPTTLTVRGWCRARDGQIHTDSKSKLITVLIYVHESWTASGGRLRLLRSPDDVGNYAVEVPPEQGTLLCFRNSSTAWHGHESYEGKRRVLQLNWVTDGRAAQSVARRHGLSALLKRMNPFRGVT